MSCGAAGWPGDGPALLCGGVDVAVEVELQRICVLPSALDELIESMPAIV